MFIAIAALVFVIYMIKERFLPRSKIMLMKAGVGLCILAVAYFALFDNYSVPSLLISIGVIFGFLGDITGIRKRVKAANKAAEPYVVGIAFFIIGHIFYLAALIVVNADMLDAIPLSAVISIITIPILTKLIKVDSKSLLGLGHFYLVIVSSVLAFSISYVALSDIPQNPFGMLFCSGAFLFWLSDYILIFRNFNKYNMQVPHVLVLAPYYFGQILICLSIFFVH